MESEFSFMIRLHPEKAAKHLLKRKEELKRWVRVADAMEVPYRTLQTWLDRLRASGHLPPARHKTKRTRIVVHAVGVAGPLAMQEKSSTA